MRSFKYLLLSLVSVPASVLGLAAHPAHAADEKLDLISKIDVGGKGLGVFDISTIDSLRDIYILADRTNAAVDVFDASDHTFVYRVGGFAGAVLNPDGTANNSKSGPDGVVVVDHKEIWAGDGDSTVKVIDIQSRKVVDTIATGTPDQLRVDEMAYDSSDNIIAMAGTPDATHTGIEQPQWSPKTGLFYVSVPQIVPGTDTASAARGGVAVIDPIGMKVTHTYEVDNCSPAGLALGPNNQAMVGCGGKFGTAPNVITQTALIDLSDGHLIKNIPVGGADEVWYDAGSKHYYIPGRNNLNPDGTPNPVLAAVDYKTLDLDPTVPISTTSHSVAVDPLSHAIFIPTGFVPPGSKPGTDPTNPCPDQGCIAVYAPSTLDGDDGPHLPPDLTKIIQSLR
jgi:hypothetical protein